MQPVDVVVPEPVCVARERGVPAPADAVSMRPPGRAGVPRSSHHAGGREAVGSADRSTGRSAGVAMRRAKRCALSEVPVRCADPASGTWKSAADSQSTEPTSATAPLPYRAGGRAGSRGASCTTAGQRPHMRWKDRDRRAPIGAAARRAAGPRRTVARRAPAFVRHTVGRAPARRRRCRWHARD